MTTTQWILNAGLLVFVLGTNLGTRPVTRRRILLPVLIAAIAGVLFLSNIPTRGNDAALEYIGGGVGVALGILAGLFMRIERNADAGMVSKAGSAYAALWILVIGGRVAFAQAADGWAAPAVRQFSIENHITGADAWTSAFVIMALTMVAARVVTTVVRTIALRRRPHTGAALAGGSVFSPTSRSGQLPRKAVRRRRVPPLQRAVLLAAVATAASVPLSLLLHILLPGVDSRGQRFIAVLVMAALAAAVALRTDPSLFSTRTRSPGLLILPAVVAVLPLVAGVRAMDPAVVGMIVAGEAATGIFEEFWFRGLTLGALQTWRPLPAAFVASGLFGMAHLANILYGADPFITAAQVVGASTFGVGYAALRLRTGGLWPLVILHAVTDIALSLGNVPGGVRWSLMIGGDTVLLVLGIWLLRRQPQGATVRSLLAASSAPAGSAAAAVR